MNEPNLNAQYVSESREREFQDPHFHDEDLDIQADDGQPRREPAPSRPSGKKVNRRPPPRRRFYED